jgi:Ca-activated chloride channel homolog
VPREEATVMLALDVSLSMQATDVLPTRIDAAKKAAIKFADLLPPKINLGLVGFAKSAEVKVPPTIDRDSFKAAVDSLELRESTAIGDAVEACLDAIRTFSASTTVKGSKPPPAQIVLLSDGTSNSGKKPLDAAQDAVKQKVPVATIAFGTPSGTVDLPGEGVQPVPADRTTLHRLADATHGSFHTAVSEQELSAIYKDLGSQIGYQTVHRDISWRFLALGVLIGMVAAATSLLWAGRLV